MNLLFTGGTGFFGKAVLRYLAAQADASRGAIVGKVTVLSRDPERFLAQNPQWRGLPWLAFHRGDIEAPETFPRDQGFTHILHAAADSTDARHLRAWQRFDQIVQGTRHLLQFAGEQGIRRFLLTSSGAVYGPQPASLEAIPESWHGMPDPLNIGATYGVAKRQAEHLCALYADRYGIEPVIARCFAFVGEDLPLDVHFAIGNFIRDALFRDEIVINGDGSPLRSYMDQSELARWLLTMLRDGTPGRAYNTGSPESVSLAELAHRVAERLAPGKPVRILGKPASDNAQRNRYVPDVSLAREALRLENRVGLDEAISRAGEGILRTRSAAGLA